MPVSPPPSSRSAIIATLRAAGCVFAEDEAGLLISAARTPAELSAMVERRAAGLPLEHVVGWAEFRGLRIAVDPGVFVPRRRTEFLVDQAVALAGGSGRLVVADLCCGSGAVGAALAAALGEVELHAVDIDPAAVRCARRNLPAAHVYQGDLYQPLSARLRGRIGVLVANVPYIPTAAIGLLPPEARDHEPRIALDGGADGLDVLRRVAAGAPRWLAPGGWLLTETSEGQASQAAGILAQAGLSSRIASSRDLDATVVIGTNALTRTPVCQQKPARRPAEPGFGRGGRGADIGVCRVSLQEPGIDRFECARPVPIRIPFRHRDRRIPDRGGGPRGRTWPLHLGHLQSHPGQRLPG